MYDIQSPHEARRASRKGDKDRLDRDRRNQEHALVEGMRVFKSTRSVT